MGIETARFYGAFNDGENDSTTLEDKTGNHTVTANGNGCMLKTAVKKYTEDTTSLYTDGSSDYATVSTFTYGQSSLLTIEYWLNFATLPGHTDTSANWVHYDNGSNYITLYHYNVSGSYTMRWGIMNGGSYYTSGVGSISAPVTGTWYHVAGVVSSQIMYVFLDGTLLNSYDNGTDVLVPSLTSDIHLGGKSGFNNSEWFNGYTSHFLVSDEAKWTSNFTPPSAPYEVGGGAGNSKNILLLGVG